MTAAHAESACLPDRIDEYAVVRSVLDGDTIHLDDGRKIRLIGINTPELERDQMPPQAYAGQARAFLQNTIASDGRRVGLRLGETRYDRHERTLAHVFTPDGDNVQAMLLQQGFAQAIAYPPNTAFADCYAQQERMARCANTGIWSHPQYAPAGANELEIGVTHETQPYFSIR